MAQTPEQFAEHLMQAAVRAAKGAQEIVDDTATKVRNDARRNARIANPSHARKVPAHINADVDRLAAEIGYDDRGQGHLGVILEYGHGRARNAPQRNLGRALDQHEGEFIRRLTDVAERALE